MTAVEITSARETSSAKHFRGGTERAVAPAETFEHARALMSALKITRIADVTGLDRIGIPVVAVYRPNARSLSVSQGKGATLLEAQVSGLMESIESYHAEHIHLPLLLASYREMRSQHRTIDVTGLARLSIGCFHEDLPVLWISGTDLMSNKRALLPYEVVHNDFRVPLPTGSGAFLMSSNGLASGNHLFEAMSHAICEVVERDANTLWQLSGPIARASRRLASETVDDPQCRAVMDAFENAGIAVVIWETTSDVGIATFLCSIVDRDRNIPRCMPPVYGSGTHPRRRIALLRALTEAAQSRLTIIAGSRDDLGATFFDEGQARDRGDKLRHLESGVKGERSFLEAPDVAHDDFETDVQWELGSLAQAGLREVVAVNLTKPELRIPVVRVVVPHLEGMGELAGYVPGRRARRMIERTSQ